MRLGVNTMGDNAVRYLEINDEIKALEEEKAKVAKTIRIGQRVTYKGHLYEWITYDRSSKGWKGLFQAAFSMLDDEAQVIVGEAESRATKVSKHHKFEKKG